MNKSGVYAIWFEEEPERKYYGSSKDVKKRINTHFKCLEKRKHYNKKLQEYYDKYTINSLKYEVFLIDLTTARFTESEMILSDSKCLNKVRFNGFIIQRKPALLPKNFFTYRTETFKPKKRIIRTPTTTQTLTPVDTKYCTISVLDEIRRFTNERYKLVINNSLQNI